VNKPKKIVISTFVKRRRAELKAEGETPSGVLTLDRSEIINIIKKTVVSVLENIEEAELICDGVVTFSLDLIINGRDICFAKVAPFSPDGIGCLKEDLPKRIVGLSLLKLANRLDHPASQINLIEFINHNGMLSDKMNIKIQLVQQKNGYWQGRLSNLTTSISVGNSKEEARTNAVKLACKTLSRETLAETLIPAQQYIFIDV